MRTPSNALKRLTGRTSHATRVRSSPLFDVGHLRRQAAAVLPAVLDDDALVALLVSDPRLREMDPGTLFDTKHYVSRYPDVALYRWHPFVHFLLHGFHEGRSCHPLIDLPYVRGSAQRAGIRLLSADDLPEAIAQVDPHPLFSNHYVRHRYGAEVDRYATPLEFYLLAKEPSIKRATVWFSPEEYLRAHPQVSATQGDPLIGYVLGDWSDHRHESTGMSLGTSNGASAADEALVAGILSTHGRRASHTSILPWPSDPQGYARLSKVPNPLLAGPLPASIRLAIGVVLYRNERTDVERLLHALQREVDSLTGERPDARVRVTFAVNDALTATYDAWRRESLLPDALVEVMDTGANVGFGTAHNMLMERAFGEYGAGHYLGLNPDGFPLRGSLADLLRLSTAVSDGALIEADAFPVGHPKWFDPISLDTAWVSGAAFLMPAGLFERVGGFDEQFHMYCEDVDLSWRVRAAGAQTLVCPTAPFFHDVVPRFGRDDPRARRAMFLSARMLGHKWGSPTFVARMEKILLEEGLVAADGLPQLPTLEPIHSDIPDFEHDLRFALSRFW